MKSYHAKIFLVEDSLELLEESKGVKILIRNPEIIQNYMNDIRYYDDAIAQGDSMINSKISQLESLHNIRGLKALFNKAQIKKEKDALNKEIEDTRLKIQEFINKKNESLVIVSNLKKEIDEFVKVLNNIKVKPEEIIEEYYRIKQKLENNEKQENNSSVNTPKKENIKTVEQNKSKSTKSAIDRFNSRMAKHNEIIKKQIQLGEE